MSDTYTHIQVLQANIQRLHTLIENLQKQCIELQHQQSEILNIIQSILKSMGKQGRAVGNINLTMLVLFVAVTRNKDITKILTQMIDQAIEQSDSKKLGLNERLQALKQLLLAEEKTMMKGMPSWFQGIVQGGRKDEA